MGFKAVRVLAAVACVAHMGVLVAANDSFGTSAMSSFPEDDFESVDDSFEPAFGMGGGSSMEDDVDGEIDEPLAEFAAAGSQFVTGEGMERSSGGSTTTTTSGNCLSVINKFRKSKGLPGLKYLKSKQTCTNKQAKNDYVNGWHDAFGDCDEYAQTECKGPTGKVQDCIQAYINEGPSGRHYKILVDRNIKYGTCGTYKANSKTSMFTQNFYKALPGDSTGGSTNGGSGNGGSTNGGSGNGGSTNGGSGNGGSTSGGNIGTTDLNNRPGLSSSECLKMINDFRSRQGRTALTYNTGREQCANTASYNDNIRGYHATFGACSERGQCQCKGFTSLAQCINAYIAEGPGGGHYEILRDARYTSVACGIYDMGGGKYFFTHNFY